MAQVLPRFKSIRKVRKVEEEEEVVAVKSILPREYVDSYGVGLTFAGAGPFSNALGILQQDF